MSDFVATYSILFTKPADAAGLTPDELEQQLFEELSRMQMLFEELPEDGMEGVQPGDVQVLDVRDIDPLHREYDVRHQVVFEATKPAPLGMEELERFGRYLNEALGVPQNDLHWRIDMVTVAPVDDTAAMVAAAV